VLKFCQSWLSFDEFIGIIFKNSVLEKNDKDLFFYLLKRGAKK
jgi:hypothetical protein